VRRYSFMPSGELLTIAAIAWLATSYAHADGDEAGSTVEEEPAYEVKRGDTLAAIASRIGTSTSELLDLNPGLTPDRIREGQKLRLTPDEAGRRVDHVVAEGEFLSRIAAQYEVTLRDLVRWNPKLSPDRVRAGQHILLYTNVPDSRSESVGSPTHGKLLFAAQLAPNPSYVVRNPERAWGTREAVSAINRAFSALRAKDPDAPKVRVHDLSLRTGGPIDDHQSHQSGRDVDITYFQKQTTGICPLRRIAPYDLDVERQWSLLRYWLDRGQAEAVFIDYDLQAKLYAYARKLGASHEQLMHWFQYPRGRGAALGIIRHAAKHDDHMHVRFVCDGTDEACHMFRVMPINASLASR
jgi:LysM repeat protein